MIQQKVVRHRIINQTIDQVRPDNSAAELSGLSEWQGRC